MKNVFFLLFIIMTPVMWAQESEQQQSVVYSSLLQQGELMSFGNRAVKFREVVSDSRCPKEVLCIWAGEAKVLIELFENDILVEEKILTVNSGAILLNYSAEGMNHSLDRILLSPYPSTREEKLDYKLEISITEKFI